MRPHWFAAVVAVGLAGSHSAVALSAYGPLAMPFLPGRASLAAIAKGTCRGQITIAAVADPYGEAKRSIDAIQRDYHFDRNAFTTTAIDGRDGIEVTTLRWVVWDNVIEYLVAVQYSPKDQTMFMVTRLHRGLCRAQHINPDGPAT